MRLALTRPGIRDLSSPQYVMLGDPLAQNDTDATIIGRSTPAGTYKWMLTPGTIVQETGRSGDNVRVRFDSQLEVWVDSTSVRSLPPGYPSPRRTVGAMWLAPAPEWVDLVMPVSSPPPYLLEQDHDRVTLTLYGTQATPDIIKFLQNDSLVRMINWVPDASDRVRISLELSQAAVRLSRALRPGARFHSPASPSAACVARASARGTDHHRRSRTSAGRRDRADGVDRSRRRPARGGEASPDPRGARRARGHDANDARRGRSPFAKRDRATNELARADLDSSQRIWRRGKPVPKCRYEYAVLSSANRTARAPRAGGDDARDGTSRPRHSLSEHCDRPHDVDAVAHLRGRVPHGSRAGERRKDRRSFRSGTRAVSPMASRRTSVCSRRDEFRRSAIRARRCDSVVSARALFALPRSSAPGAGRTESRLAHAEDAALLCALQSARQKG